eukprot:48385-Rhodomonas_salina.2
MSRLSYLHPSSGMLYWVSHSHTPGHSYARSLPATTLCHHQIWYSTLIRYTYASTGLGIARVGGADSIPVAGR